MRLIDADKINPTDVFMGATDFAQDCRDAVERLIAMQPTIKLEDLIPTAHLKRGNPEEGKENHIYCSSCGSCLCIIFTDNIDVEKAIEHTYATDKNCSKCGARLEKPQEI